MKIIQNALKIEETFSDVQNLFRVGPEKVRSVGFPETIHFFFLPCAVMNVSAYMYYCIVYQSMVQSSKHIISLVPSSVN